MPIFEVDSYAGTDLQKLQEARDEAAANGSGTLACSNRDYLLSGRLRIRDHNIKLLGDPSGWTKFKYTGSSVHSVVHFDAKPGEALLRPSIENIAIDGGDAADRCVALKSVREGYFNNVRCMGVKETGFAAFDMQCQSSVSNGGCSENVFGFIYLDVRNTGAIGMVWQGTNPPENNIHHNTFLHLDIWTGWGDGLRAYSSDSNSVHHIRTWKNWVGTSGGGYGIRFKEQTGGGRPRSNDFWSASLGKAGFHVDGNSINDNTIFSNIKGNGSDQAPHYKGTAPGVIVVSGEWKD